MIARSNNSHLQTCINICMRFFFFLITITMKSERRRGKTAQHICFIRLVFKLTTHDVTSNNGEYEKKKMGVRYSVSESIFFQFSHIQIKRWRKKRKPLPQWRQMGIRGFARIPEHYFYPTKQLVHPFHIQNTYILYQLWTTISNEISFAIPPHSLSFSLCFSLFSLLSLFISLVGNCSFYLLVLFRCYAGKLKMYIK